MNFEWKNIKGTRHYVLGSPKGAFWALCYFLLFVNDMDEDLIHSRVLLYADDTILYASKSINKAAHLWVSEDLQLLSNLCGANQLQ